MEPVFPPATSVPGVLHYIPPNLSSFEPAKPLIDGKATNTILWVGGLCDTYLSVSYPLAIAKALGPTWSLITASLSSSGLQFGISSIKQDTEDISKILAYIRSLRPAGKLVLMGHSTGCQDCLQYTMDMRRLHRVEVQGLILQAPVSDREAIGMVLPEAHIAEANRTALGMRDNHNGNSILANRLTKPVFGNAPISAHRWHDLAIQGGADDMFSSDLSGSNLDITFGSLPEDMQLLILYSDQDEYVPKTVDKQRLVTDWLGCSTANAPQLARTKDNLLVPDATHNLNGCPEIVIQDITTRVLTFINEI